MKSELILLINPLSMHKTFCERLSSAGIKLIALYTISPPEGYFALDKNYFIAVEILSMNLNQDLQNIKQSIQGYDLINVIPAYEIDFEYAEKLAYALCPQSSNHPQNSYLRCKKYEMNEAMKQAGLNAIAQVRILGGGVAPAHLPLRFPVIVKPSYQSAGSIGVKVCHNLDEVEAQVNILQQSLNVVGGKKFVVDIAIQEKIEGIEYFTDSVSWKGRHYITAIFKYNKVEIDGCPIYRYIEFINPHEPIWQLCYNYSLKTLDALEVNFGFAHTEFMLTQGQELYLMEINPRISGLGGQINRLCKLLTDYDQSDLYVSLLTQEKMPGRLAGQYQQQDKHGRIVLLFSWEHAVFKGFAASVLQELKSHQVRFHLFKSEGNQLTPPKDLFDVVMAIILVDENPANIERDTEFLQRLEKEGGLFND